MHALTLLTLGLLGQVGKVDTPTMQFTNNTHENFRLWIFCRDTQRWESNGQPLVLRPNATASIKLREGRFQVLAKNQYGQQDINERKLVARELDWMDIEGIYGGPITKTFKIAEHRIENEIPPAGSAPAPAGAAPAGTAAPPPAP